MTIVQFEYLIAVASFGSFSTASDHCFVTQPSLSTQIKNLEEELGVTLLNRNNKPITLTEAGEVAVAKAREAIGMFNSVKDSVNQLKNSVVGSLRLAVIPTIAPYLLHKFIPQFIERYPEVSLEIKEMYTRDIVVALSRGVIDAAILAGGFTEPQKIREETLFEDKFLLYAAKGHPLYDVESINIKDIDVSKLILLADGHCLRTQVLDLCHSRGLASRGLMFESGSLETIMRVADATSSLTIIPAMAASFVEGERRKSLKPILDPDAMRVISIATDKSFFKHSLLTAMKKSIEEVTHI